MSGADLRTAKERGSVAVTWAAANQNRRMRRAAVAQDSQLPGRLQPCLLLCLGQFRRKACVDRSVISRSESRSKLSLRTSLIGPWCIIGVPEGHRNGHDAWWHANGAERMEDCRLRQLRRFCLGPRNAPAKKHGRYVGHVCIAVLHGISMLLVLWLVLRQVVLHGSSCYGCLVPTSLQWCRIPEDSQRAHVNHLFKSNARSFKKKGPQSSKELKGNSHNESPTCQKSFAG